MGAVATSTRSSAQAVRDFAEAEIAPHAAQWDEEHHFPVDAVLAMGELGLFGIVFPEEWGGSGGDFASLCVAIEEIGRVDQSLGITLSAGVGLGANPIYQFGNDDQKAEWLPDLVAGRALGGFGLTEPDGGSDAGATRTRAVLQDGDGWVIDGAKAFITNCGTPITSLITVTARTDERHLGVRRRGRHAGLRRRARRTASSAGTPATRTASRSTAAACPRPTCSASRAQGFRNFLDDPRRRPDRDLRAGARLRPGVPRASPSTTPRSATRSAARSAATRASPSQLADLAVAVENARNLTYKAAWLKDQGRPIGEAAAMAKLYSTEAAVDARAHRHAGVRRRWVHGGDARRPLLPRRQDPRDRRRHERDPAPRHRPRSRPAGVVSDDASDGEEAVSDFAARMSYSDYLDLDRLLDAQHPLSTAHRRAAVHRPAPNVGAVDEPRGP